MNNLIIFLLHAIIAVLVIIPMFLIAGILKFAEVIFYTLKNALFGNSVEHSTAVH